MKYTKTNKQILSESGRKMNQSIIQQSRFTARTISRQSYTTITTKKNQTRTKERIHTNNPIKQYTIRRLINQIVSRYVPSSLNSNSRLLSSPSPFPLLRFFPPFPVQRKQVFWD